MRWRRSINSHPVLLGLALLFWASGLAAQSIRGTVTDSTSAQPLDNVLVVVLGTGLQTVTTNDGTYFFNNVSAGDRVVRVQRIGYSPTSRIVTVTEGQETVADFVLVPRPAQLEELVSWGYGTETRAEATTAVSSVSGASMAGEPIAGLDGALLGKAAGVQVIQNAGTPGNGISVRVRGAASLTAGSQPLYVLDGVPVTTDQVGQLSFSGQNISGITGLSANDIDRIDILKDAAAASIYGSRGSNGVVLITTKRGTNGPARVSFNASTGWQSLPKKLDMMNSTEYLTFFNEAAENDGYGQNYYGVVGTDDAINTDWQDAIFKTAPVTTADLAVTGGNDLARYRLSGTIFNQDGITIGSEYRRLNGRVNLDFGRTDKFSVSTNLAVSGERNQRIRSDNTSLGAIPNAIAAPPYLPVKQPGGLYTSTDDGLTYPNPVAIGVFNNGFARTSRVVGNVEARGVVSPGLQLTGRVGVDFLSLHETRYESQKVIGSDAERGNGKVADAFESDNKYVFDGLVSYDRAWDAGRHGLSLTTGTSLELYRTSWNFIAGENLGDFTEIGNATVITDHDGAYATNNLISYFGRANYTFLDKYLLGASFRYDGSSRFGPNRKWGFFPGLSLGWVMSEEPFLMGTKAIDQLKLRASYGLTGNQPLGNYPWLGGVCSTNYGPEAGLVPCGLTNEDLKWERTAQLNIGADASLFNGRLGIIADWYHKTTRDLLVLRDVPATSGQPDIYANFGNIVNNGVELQLTAQMLRPNQPSALSWTTTLNLAHNRNEVTKMYHDQPLYSGVNAAQVGHPLGSFYTYKFMGVDPATGNALYKSRAGGTTTDPTSEDQFFVGNPWPSLSGGLTNTVTWNRFDLSFLFDFSHGAKVYNAMRTFSGNSGGNDDNQFRDQLGRWQQVGDRTNIPRASIDGSSGATLDSDRFIEDANYIRLLDLSLGFRLPERFASAVRLSNARLYFSGHNLFTITGYEGYFPDVNTSGSSANISLANDFYTYPIARSFSFGVQAGW